MTETKPTEPFTLVLRSFRGRDGRPIRYWAESEPGLALAEIEAEILNGAIDDAEMILRVCPVEGICANVTKEVAERIGKALTHRFNDGDDLLDSESAVEFAERFSDWSRPRPETGRSYEQQHRLQTADVI
jgi:hypothetical protein